MGSSTDAATRKQHAKLLQVMHNFFTKLLQLIVQARSANETTPSSTTPAPTSRSNKWFNLNLNAVTDTWLKHELQSWKSQAETFLLPPIVIETVLDFLQLSPRGVLMLEDDNNSSWVVAEGDSKKQEVVVERWLIEFDRSAVTTGQDELPLIYKKAIIQLRVIFGMIYLLPTAKLRKHLAKGVAKGVSLKNRIVDVKAPVNTKTRIGLLKSIIPHEMLLTTSHMTQRDFCPIESSLGTLRVSVAYRNNHKFKAQDREERLSDHFAISDKVRELSSGLASRQTKSPLPCSSLQFSEELPQKAKLKLVSIAPIVSTRPSIQPFRVGSLSNSPPPQSPHGGSFQSLSIERRVSITSNRLGSNASLAALLRNARGSTSASNTPTAAVISGSQSNIPAFMGPRLNSSSHGALLLDDHGDGLASTPRFSSSFGSRYSRRFSNTSNRVVSTTADPNVSFLGTSLESGSSGVPLSGLYADDDISSFVRMIDGKLDLRLVHSASDPDSRLGTPQTENSASHLEALNKFQQLKNQHQQLGDNVNASIVLHHGHNSSRASYSGSKTSSRKSLPPVYLPPPQSLPLSSFDNSHLPSISLRLNEREAGFRSSRSPSDNCQGSLPLVSTGLAHASSKSVVSGLATSPSTYAGIRKPIRYEDVFDEEDNGEDDSYFHSNTASKSGARVQDEFENDELLFEMTDTR